MMNIKAIIADITTYIPVTWPLQSFIAMNPLWDRTQQSLPEILQELNALFPIAGTLSLSHYHRLYREKNISENEIKQAVTLWFKQNDEALTDFLTAANVQFKLEKISENTLPKIMYHEKNHELIGDQIIKWCTSFFDKGQAILPMPTTQINLFAAWREMVVFESKSWHHITDELHSSPEEAIEKLIEKLQIPAGHVKNFLMTIIFQVKGWASFIKWRQQPPPHHFTEKKATIADLIAIALCYVLKFNKSENSFDSIIKQSSSTSAINKIWVDWCIQEKKSSYKSISFNYFSLCWIWQTAWEFSYQNELIKKITTQGTFMPSTTLNQKPSAQLVFCIDARSEGIRRHLECLNNYETFGFAGFFGFAFQLKDEKTGYTTLQSPPLITPKTVVNFKKNPSKTILYSPIKNFINTIGHIKSKGLTAYALFEWIGPWLSLKLLGKTLTPQFYQKIKQKQADKKYFGLEDIENSILNNIDSIEATACAENFLKTIGLKEKFAPIVVICGHGAVTDNNPYQSSFDCGACGGHAGQPNAIVACALLNQPIIRKNLHEKGIDIPSSTLFVPAYHNTTTDKVTLLTHVKNKTEHLEQLQGDLLIASKNLKQERLLDLPGTASAENRQAHWAELIPEMGLANNAAIIIGPRKMTQELNLQRRTFLHSYEPDLDPTGELLEGILTAPVIIAHWINSQYYFSTTDPDYYGSGNKTLHNVVGKLGVMLGNHSDLKIGLPLQSVYYQSKLIHQPIKLTVVIYANKKIVEQLLDKHEQIKNLFDGQWAYLRIIESRSL